MLTRNSYPRRARLVVKTDDRTFCRVRYWGHDGEVAYDVLIAANLTHEGIELFYLSRAEVLRRCQPQHSRGVSSSLSLRDEQPLLVLGWDECGATYEATIQLRTRRLKRQVAELIARAPWGLEIAA